MALKIIKYDVELLSTKMRHQFVVPEFFTNDLHSVEFHFNVLDAGLDLTGATANVLLYMKDGSFFQNTPETGVTIDGNTVKYRVKENEGNHAGTGEVQLVVKVSSLIEYSSQLFKFTIHNGLETKVAQEQMIQEWSSLTNEAREFLSVAKTNEIARQEAESERKTAESNRDTAETTRQQQETSRVNAETLRMEQFQDMQLTQNIDSGKSYKTTLEIYDGLPRLKMEEVTNG